MIFAGDFIRRAQRPEMIALIVCSAGLMLAGCADSQPGQSETYRPCIKVVSNKVCMTLPHLKSGEKLLSIYISERGNNAGYLMRQYPWRKGKYLAAEAGKCVPDFNFPYVTGRGYDVAIQVANPAEATLSGTAQGRIYSGAFTLWRDGKKLHISPVLAGVELIR